MILVATSGYMYRDWKGRFYPKNIKDSDMLLFYSSHFPFTEINSSYYRMPNSHMFYHMVQKTPQGFLFTVKAYGKMTHEGDLSKQTVDKFLDALKPLIEHNRLGCVLFQFPYSFRNTEKNRNYLKRIRDRMKNIPIAVEFRNADWLKQDIIRILKENNISLVSVDEPRLKGLLPPVVAITGPFGYIRFHGRNTSKWYNHNKAYERYDYLYTEKELKEWIPRIKTISSKVPLIFISMNNHFNAKAVINAKQMIKLLSEHE